MTHELNLQFASFVCKCGVPFDTRQQFAAHVEETEEYCPPNCAWCAAIDTFCSGESGSAPRRATRFAVVVSEDEIDAATDAVMHDYALFRHPRYGTELVRSEVKEILRVALAASRGVLLPKETT